MWLDIAGRDFCLFYERHKSLLSGRACNGQKPKGEGEGENSKAKARAKAKAKARSNRKLKARLERKSHQIICLCCQMLQDKATKEQETHQASRHRQRPWRAVLSILSTLNSHDVSNMP